MSESDKIISHESWLHLKEHLHHVSQHLAFDVNPFEKKNAYLATDNDRCIKILEDCKDAQ